MFVDINVKQNVCFVSSGVSIGVRLVTPTQHGDELLYAQMAPHVVVMMITVMMFMTNDILTMCQEYQSKLNANCHKM